MVRDGACFKCTYPLRIDLEQSLLYYVPGEIPGLIIHVHLLHQPFLSQSHSNPAFYNLHTVLSENRLSQYLMQFITCHYIYIYISSSFSLIYIANFEVYFIFKQLSCG